MSEALTNTVNTSDLEEVFFSTFSGGKSRGGRCLQLAQRRDRGDGNWTASESVHMNRDQVRQAIEVMQAFLDE